MRIAILAALLVLAGCADGDGPAAEETPRVPVATSASPSTDAERLEAECMSLLPDDYAGERIDLEGDGIRLPGALTRPETPGRTGVVLLPQSAPGYCGWLAYQQALTERGATVIAVDVCGYGEAECDDGVGIADQVDLAVEQLRSEEDVRRVVLMGASMGGSLTVQADAADADIDEWIDLSGPGEWDGVRLVSLAGKVRPGLVMHAPDDGEYEFQESRRVARATGSRFIAATSGHGWDMLMELDGRLTRDGRTIASTVCPEPGC